MNTEMKFNYFLVFFCLKVIFCFFAKAKLKKKLFKAEISSDTLHITNNEIVQKN